MNNSSCFYHAGGETTLICPTEHEYTLYLPSKNNLYSKNTIQHFCRCRDQLEKVFPFYDCPDLKALEVTLSPQSCSNQHPLFCPTYAPPTPCPTPITPVCNCNCTSPNFIELKDVCNNQSGVSSATISTDTLSTRNPSSITPSTTTSSTVTPSTSTPSTTTPSTATLPNSKISQECTGKCKSTDELCVNLSNSTLSLISNLANFSSVQNAELKDLTESVKLIWLTMVCVFVLLLVVTVLQVSVLLAVHCRSEKPNKKIDIVMLDEIIRPNVKDDDGIMITNDMYDRF